LIAEDAQDAELREVNVAVDEPGKDQAIFEVRHRQVGVAPGELGEVAEVLDDAVPDDQEAIADEARGAVLMAGCFHGSSTKSKKLPRMAQLADMNISSASGPKRQGERLTVLLRRRGRSEARRLLPRFALIRADSQLP